MPNWCQKEVTQEKFIAGRMICDKKYEDIKPKLVKYGYIRK